jgi:hypothetical protein
MPSGAHLVQDLGGPQIEGRGDVEHMMAQHLVGHVAEETLGGVIPEHEPAVEIYRADSAFQGVEEL